MSRIRDTIFVALMLIAIAALVHYVAGCAQSAEAAYTAALLRCVDKARTLEESRECRRHVDGDYGITQTARDGGK